MQKIERFPSVCVALMDKCMLVAPAPLQGIERKDNMIIFSLEKQKAVQKVMKEVWPLLCDREKIKPIDNSGMLPYFTPTKVSSFLDRRLPGLNNFLGSPFTENIAREVFEGEERPMYYARGIVLGDLLIA